MKKLILSCAVACAALFAGINQTYAQDATPHFGIKAGADLMTLGSSTDNGISINYTSRVGFQAGVYGDLPLSSVVSFMPQVLFTQKGGNIKTSITIDATELRVEGHSTLNYVDVPLLFAIKPAASLNLYVGPQVGLFISQKSTISATDGTNSTNDSNSSSDGFRKVLLGGNVGVGYNIIENVGVDLNYLFDFQHAADSSQDTGEKNSGFALTVRYSF